MVDKHKIAVKDKSTARRHRIAASLRKAIVTGKYQPGQQLPTRVVLEQRFKVSPETLQRSFDELKADGFLRAQRRGGTFVVDYPPHLHRYGLALGSDQEDAGFTQFFTVLAEQARSVKVNDGDTVPVFYGVADTRENTGIINLTQDIEHHRLAGVIYVGFVPERFEACKLPQVVVSSNVDVDGSVVSILSMSQEHYVQKAVSYFAQRGCKRLGVLSVIGWQKKTEQFLLKACREAGIALEEQWFQLISLTDTFTARRITQLLMHPDHTRRPDALLIADDNLIEHVDAGLRDVQVDVAQDLTIVAHANFPSRSVSDLPMRRLGYDTRQVIGAGIHLINERRDTQSTSRIYPIEPYFEDELR